MSTDARTERIQAIARSGAAQRGPLLPILHAIVDEFRYLAPGDAALVADILNLSEAEVHGVATFYKDFRTTPAPERSLQVCRGEACQAVGADALLAAARRAAAQAESAPATAPGEALEIEEIFCFGNCALGPSVRLDGRLHGRMTPDQLNKLLASADGTRS